MKDKKAFVLTDNLIQYNRFIELINQKKLTNVFTFYTSKNSPLTKHNVPIIDVKEKQAYIIQHYDIAISLHCKQMFPSKLVNSMPCVNIHPGFNPHNRGWYPQVFSIIEDKIIGATIHVMDEKLDNGYIIDRQEVKKFLWDTSESLYHRILDAEMELINKNITALINLNYNVIKPEQQGVLRLKKDFNELCQINLQQEGRFIDFYNRLRALTHGNFKNAYIKDPETGKKIYLKLEVDAQHD